MKKYKVILITLVSLLFISNYSYSNLSELENFNPSKYYKLDSDGDGIIDIYDSEPNVYNVTDRDLRFFQEITYRTPEEIRKIFSNDSSYIEYFNREKLRDGADVREIIKNWVFVEQITDTNGFQASIFRNGNQAVLAFTGTNDVKDVGNDISIGFAIAPGQAWNAEKIINEKMKGYSKYYITGHSLGGYLTMYAGATSAFNDERFIHGAVFNSPGLNLTFNRKVWSNSDKNIYSDYVDNSDKRNIKNLKKIQAYGIHGDGIAGMKQIPTTKWNNQVTTNIKAHSSSNFVATKNDKNFRDWFSVGYRLDNPYLTLDTDGDGILDVDELKIGTDYTKFDSDSDGFGDKLELAFSTDPMDSSSKPLLSNFYKAVRYGDLLVDKKSDIDVTKLEGRLTFVLKSEFEKYKKQIPELYGENGKYIFENLPSSWADIKDYKFLIRYKIQLPDSSYTDSSIMYIYIKENKENENKKENELYKIKIPNKIGVVDINNISEEEKKLIEKNIIESNKNIPKKLTVNIDANGNIIIYFEDNSTVSILSSEIVYQKSMSETFKFVEIDKVGVENLNLLTEEEKQEVINRLRLSNNTEKIKKINVLSNGEVDIIFLDDTILHLPKEKFINQTLDKIKLSLLSAESKLEEIRNIKLQKSVISIETKKIIDNKIDEYDNIRKNILEKLKVVDSNTEGFNELREKINNLEIIEKVVVNDYNSNNIIDDEEIYKGFELIKLAKQKLIEYENKISENKLITKEIKDQIDEIVDEYLKLKNDAKVYLSNLNLSNIENLNNEYKLLKDISKVEISDEVNEEKIYESNLKYASELVNKVLEKYNEMISKKGSLNSLGIISKNDKLDFDKLYNDYVLSKNEANSFMSGLKESDRLMELKQKLINLNEVLGNIVINDINNNGIVDNIEIEKAKEMLIKLNKLSSELDSLTYNLSAISKELEKNINQKVKEYLNIKEKLYEYLVNLDLDEKEKLINEYKLLQSYNNVSANDLDSNNIIDSLEILEVRKKIKRTIDMLEKIRMYQDNNLSAIVQEEENIFEMVKKYLEYREDAINSVNKLSDLIEGKSELMLEINSLPTEKDMNELIVDKTSLKNLIDSSDKIKLTVNYEKSDNNIKEEFNNILNNAKEIYSNNKSSQDEVEDIKLKLENILKLLNGNLNDSIKYVNLLHYTDTSILNFMNNDGLLFNFYFKKSVLNYFEDIVRDDFKLNSILGGIQLGYNHKINEKLSAGIFAEYSNTTSHNISLGIDLKNKNFGFFTRYRLNIVPKDRIYSNNLDMYLKLSNEFNIIKDIKIEPILSIYGTYMARTYLPNEIYIDHKVSGSINAAINARYENETFRLYLEPQIRYIYDNSVLYDKNNNKKVYDNSYYDYIVRLGLEKKISDIILGSDFTFNGNKNTNNYRLNMYINYTFR